MTHWRPGRYTQRHYAFLFTLESFKTPGKLITAPEYDLLQGCAYMKGGATSSSQQAGI
jgi:hypothetical protein